MCNGTGLHLRKKYKIMPGCYDQEMKDFKCVFCYYFNDCDEEEK